MDHMRRRGRGIVTVVALVAVACVCAYFVASHSRSLPAPAIDFSGGEVPPEFHALRIGMSMREVRLTVGKAPVEHSNPQFEVKSDAEWANIKRELDSRRAAQMDASAVPDLAYLKLGQEYEHRAKELWVYYPGQMKVWVSLQFDGNGKLMNVASGVSGKSPGH